MAMGGLVEGEISHDFKNKNRTDRLCGGFVKNPGKHTVRVFFPLHARDVQNANILSFGAGIRHTQ